MQIRDFTILQFYGFTIQQFYSFATYKTIYYFCCNAV